jgi:L-amino acid N-acyltransferase YncA
MKRLAHKSRSALRIVREAGWAELVRRFRDYLYSRDATLLLECTLDPPPPEPVAGLELRRATAADAPALFNAWPAEFAELTRDPRRREIEIRRRFDADIPCYIALDSGEIIGAMWCDEWLHDSTLPADRRGRPAFIVRNAFVVQRARGRGVFVQLGRFALRSMAQAGKEVAFSRIRPSRKASLRAHAKLGFRIIGRLVTGYSLWRRHLRLEPLQEKQDA